MTNVSLECRCGQLRGTVADVTPAMGNRAICYCRDCQAYAHYLGLDGILDPQGGSDVFQMAPAYLTIDSGMEHLACMQLAKGGVLRWYASCCRTPVANTTSWSRLPFIGLVQPFMKHPAAEPRDEVLGPVRMAVRSKSAVGGPLASGDTLKVTDMFRSGWLLTGAILRGKHRPSPFFDRDGKPTVIPTVLSDEEHAALYTKLTGH